MNGEDATMNGAFHCTLLLFETTLILPSRRTALSLPVLGQVLLPWDTSKTETTLNLCKTA